MWWRGLGVAVMLLCAGVAGGYAVRTAVRNRAPPTGGWPRSGPTRLQCRRRPPAYPPDPDLPPHTPADLETGWIPVKRVRLRTDGNGGQHLFWSTGRVGWKLQLSQGHIQLATTSGKGNRGQHLHAADLLSPRGLHQSVGVGPKGGSDRCVSRKPRRTATWRTSTVEDTDRRHDHRELCPPTATCG